MKTVELGKYRGVGLSPGVTTSTGGCTRCGSSKTRKGQFVPLEKVMAYQNEDVVGRIKKEIPTTPENAKEIFDDVKRFLWLAAKRGDITSIPTPVIDKGWHEFLMFTKDYAEFCEAYFGTFIHHEPHRIGAKPVKIGDILVCVDSMWDEFGHMPSSNWNYTLCPSKGNGVLALNTCGTNGGCKSSN